MGAENGLREWANLRQVQRIEVADIWRPDRRFARSRLRPDLTTYYFRNPGSLVRRIASTLRHGFANHYLTVVWKKHA